MISFNPPPISSSVMTFPSLSYKISFSDTSISSSSNPSSLSSSSSTLLPPLPPLLPPLPPLLYHHLPFPTPQNCSQGYLHHFRLPPYYLECHSIHHLQTFDRHSLHHHHYYPLQHRSPVELHHSSLQLSTMPLPPTPKFFQ